MSATPTDTVACCPTGLVGTALACFGHLRGWLRRLTDIADGLADRIGHAASARPANPASARTVDLDVAWMLLERALLWTCALNARFVAQATAAAKAAGVWFLDDPRDRPAERRAARPTEAVAAAGGRMTLGRCIAGKSVPEVMAQICADLGAAATLLDDGPAAQEIAAIAAATRALLEGPDAAWTPLPVPAAPPRPVGDAAPAAVTAAGPVPVVAPDTG